MKAFVSKDNKKIQKSHKQNKPSTYDKIKIKIPINMEYPVAISDIPLYEELNDIQINVFSLDGFTQRTDYVDPHDTDDIRQYIKEEYKSNQHRKDVMNLLLISKDDNFHYVLINNLSRLFCS